MKTSRAFLVPLALMLTFGILEFTPRIFAQIGSTAVPVPSKSLRIRAAVKKGEIKGSLILEWSLKNISRKNITFRDTYVLHDYSFVVTDREGRNVQPTEAGRRKILESGLISHRDFVALRPGEEVRRQLIITEIYNLSPGEIYAIYLERQISLDKGKTLEKARSNLVRARVEE